MCNTQIMPLFLTDQPPIHEVSAELGFDSTFVVRTRYAHGLSTQSPAVPPVLAGLTVTVPIFASSSLGSDGQVALDARSRVWQPASPGAPWGAELVVSTALSWAEDAGGRSLAWSAEARLRPGLIGTQGRVALDLGWRPTLATHIRHSALVQDLFADRYPDGHVGEGPYDGWYRAPSGRIHLGLTGAWRHAQGAFIEAGGGWSRLIGPLPAFADIGVLPFYTYAQGGWQW